MNIADQLEKNLEVFKALLNIDNANLIQWRPAENKWSLLEIVCHLYDEERLDFRFRTQWTLERPGEIPPTFNPLKWVEDHDYASQNFRDTLNKFESERIKSVKWLRGLSNVSWDNAFEHPKLGTLSAAYFLNNWLAHDYLHIRQINRYKYEYFSFNSNHGLDYAGNW